MSRGLNLIIVDDDPTVCVVLAEMVKRFYTWGEVLSFTNADEATLFCQTREAGVAIFVLDVFLGKKSGFAFLETILNKFPMAYQDTIMVTGNASNDVVDRCVSSDITYLLEKPIRPYALQLAIRAIVAKYVKFAKKLLQDPLFAENVARF